MTANFRTVRLDLKYFTLWDVTRRYATTVPRMAPVVLTPTTALAVSSIPKVARIASARASVF